MLGNYGTQLSFIKHIDKKISLVFILGNTNNIIYFLLLLYSSVDPDVHQTPALGISAIVPQFIIFNLLINGNAKYNYQTILC